MSLSINYKCVKFFGPPPGGLEGHGHQEGCGDMADAQNGVGVNVGQDRVT